MRSISVVVPAYNEEALIEQCVREISHVLLEIGGEHEIVIVDDGSTDKTTAVALDVASVVPHVRALRLLRNMGKGAALVFGAGQSSCELIAFVDADLEVHPRQLALLCASLVSAPAEVAIGSKHHPGAHVSLDRGRRFLSLLYAKVVQALFVSPCDTQTGSRSSKPARYNRRSPRGTTSTATPSISSSWWAWRAGLADHRGAGNRDVRPTGSEDHFR